MTSQNVLADLKKLADPEKAQFLQRYFKTGKGEYGEGDMFWGIKVPETRKVVKKYKDLPLLEIEKLLKSEVHEVRLAAALFLVEHYKKNPKKHTLYTLRTHSI